MHNYYLVGAVVVMCVVTALLRFTPFLIFGEDRETPKWVSDLGKILPLSIMGMLVVYCLKETSITKAPYAIPEVISCVLVVVLHRWKRNTLLSVFVGTLVYMFLVQTIMA